MTKASILGGALLAVFISTAAEAKLYKWVDDKGVTHYGEVVPPEYADKDQKQIEKGREIEKKAPVTKAGPAKPGEEDQATRDSRRRDEALLGTYSNEGEIDLARDRNLQQVEARINSVKLLIQSAQESLDGFKKEEEETKAAGKKIPPSLQSDIDGAESKVAKLKQELAAAEAKAAAVKASFEADKVRYRELRGLSQK